LTYGVVLFLGVCYYLGFCVYYPSAVDNASFIKIATTNGAII